MKFKKIEINHMENPLGYKFDSLFISGILEASCYPSDLQKMLLIYDHQELVFQSDWEKADDLVFEPDLVLQPRTRYRVQMQLKYGEKHLEKETWFETGVLDSATRAKWIGPENNDWHGIELFKSIHLPHGVKKARLYITGLGVYECFLDDEKIGDEYLAPGFTNYHYYTQLATHDLTTAFQQAGKHTFKIILGDGWYRGKIGITPHGGSENSYGDALMALAEIHYVDKNDETHVLITDETWQCRPSKITHSGIYYGEDINDLAGQCDLVPVIQKKPEIKYLLDRLSPPVKLQERFEIKEVLTTTTGEKILDFGQNLSGWLFFANRLPRGHKVSIEFGELLQDGDLYTQNLRSARATFTYISDGMEKWIRPHFTYFGFRYAKITGFESFSKEDFFVRALYSDMQEIGHIETDRQDVNRLFKNVKWGQKSNFVDIPTDCPQRDERLGWTGDAAIFAKTASYNMDTYSFFKRFAFEIAVEQSLHEGRVPLYAPAIHGTDGGKAVWGDAATIIPWAQYERTNDPAILKQNFGAMMSWVDWIHEQAKQTRNEFLWLDSDQLGDWLALDTEDIMRLKGRTPDDLIASAYYYHSCQIVSKTAGILGKKREQDYYKILADQIKEAFQEEFFTKNGRLITDTQTGLAVCLKFQLVPEEHTEKVVKKLVERIARNGNHLTTGFVGTALLLPVLSQYGEHELACQLFLNTDYPSWLYQVEKGATTIWERWDSVDAQGKIAENGMNSLNHYSTGSVMEWGYEYLLGIRQKSRHEVLIAPGITPRFQHVSGYTAINGDRLTLSWKIMNPFGNKVQVELLIPFGVTAQVDLPNTHSWSIHNERFSNGDTLSAGRYVIEYEPETPFISSLTIYSPLLAFNQKQELVKKIAEYVPFWGFLSAPNNMANFEKYSLIQLSNEMKGIGFPELTQEDIHNINAAFKQYTLENLERK
ncbi:family 78 glycoside hydrolase catalytic domain [Listeria ilorinensis]|uniref:family 78 glycoside hydrolase catalytic domain n=1 Tax=Listeria ilorinensis TaxID=2867439 RepID=UPI001EF4D434|nr:family 78 glycoside hydrolase catalytic domain [Listeria ilorinensis]